MESKFKYIIINYQCSGTLSVWFIKCNYLRRLKKLTRYTSIIRRKIIRNILIRIINILIRIIRNLRYWRWNERYKRWINITSVRLGKWYNSYNWYGLNWVIIKTVLIINVVWFWIWT